MTSVSPAGGSLVHQDTRTVSTSSDDQTRSLVEHEILQSFEVAYETTRERKAAGRPGFKPRVQANNRHRSQFAKMLEAQSNIRCFLIRLG